MTAPWTPPGKLPRHIAIIMDGNGRWAERHGLPRVEGHKRGADSVRDVVRAAREIHLEALTLYAFSSQNWERPLEEVQALMQLLRDYVLEERAEIMDNGIRLIAIGDTGRLPDLVREPLDALIRDSANNPSMTLCLALSYGGREAITAVARTLAQEVREGRLEPSMIGQDTFEARLATTAQGLPPLDLLVRTSGEQRISNFLLWEAAYAELYFAEKQWPDFRRGDLYAAIDVFAGRERRFGLTGDQIRVLGGTGGK